MSSDHSGTAHEATPAELSAAMDEALRLAESAASEGEVPVGAVILHEGKIIGRGKNSREKAQSPLGHAEIEAIAEAARALGSWRLVGCTLVVTLEPCPMCLGALQQARVEHAFYGASDPKGGALSLGYKLHEDARLNHRFEVSLREEPRCGEILTRFFRDRRAKK